MATEITQEQKDLFANKIFLNAVLPLLKTILEDRPALQKKWAGPLKVCQVSCKLEDGGKDGTHFLFEEGVCTPKRGLYEEGTPDLDLEFSSAIHLNKFFKNQTKKLPKLKGGLKNPGLLVKFLGLLMKMGGLLGATSAPKKQEDQELLVKCMFYLLSRGINILNKMGHPDVTAWTEKSPDRVYAFAVEGYPDLAAHLRIKKGKSMARRGEYTKSMPFFTMKFDSPLSALGILQDTDDMIEATIAGRLIMVGGPEFGAQLGDHMLAVGDLIQ